MYSSISKHSEPDNDWANDVKDDPIHISQALSGLNGYYCMGCNKVMQAVKMKNPKHQSYFRHHIKDVDTSKIECVHASKEYREKLAYFYFMRVKQIKVPAVYKYPPKGEEGYPMLLKEATTISAHSIKREVIIFEDENGKIHWDNKEKVDERFLWIRPDAVFYNEEDKPILFLEFVVTHKPDIDKINKLQRLGINTVQIIVPKLPEAELEKSISSVSKVKWTYNEIESNTEYIPVSSGDTEGIPFIDEEQRKLFEESYKCRAAQVGNLIRSIKRCVGSQSYKRVEQHFEQEISRIEKATREHQSRLVDIRGGIEREIHSELGERREELDKRRDKFQQYYSELEGRYLRKRGSLIEKQGDTGREIEFRHGIGKSEKDIRQKSDRIEDDIRRKFEKEERFLIEEETGIESEQRNVKESQRSNLRDLSAYTAFEKDFGGKEESIRREFDQLEESERKIFERKKSDIESAIVEFREIQREEETGIRSNYEREYQQILERINNRDIQGGDELSERIKTILELRGLFDGYSNSKNTIEKYRKGIRYLKDGTWKEWD